MGEIAFYGRLTASHEWQLIFTTDENMMRGMFLPKLIKVEVLSIDPTTRIVVSLNVSEARNDLS
jgi:hypothetical protein